MLSVHDTGPFAPCPAPFNMAEHVLRAGLDTPAKTALLVVGADDAETWTYAELRRAVLGTASGFRAMGLPEGAKVLLRLGNTVDFPLAYLGALAAGYVPVPTAAALTAAETQAIIDGLAPDLIVSDPSVPCPASPLILDITRFRAFRDLPAAEISQGDPERLGYIIYTSGTSGVPRAVGHAHRAIWARQMMFDGWYGLRPQDLVMHAGAFNWTYTLGTGLMDPWTRGATALIPAAGTPASALPDLMRAYDVTIFAAAPGVYRQMLARTDRMRLPRLRHGLSAGEKLPVSVAEKWHDVTGCDLFEAYGMSECSTFISHAPGAKGPRTALGRPQPGRCVAILRDGVAVPRGTEGTIAVHRRDPGLMLKYLGAPEETARRFAGDWFLTGDQGVMDDAGYVTYLGRDDDMMNAGGFRVSPIEVENTLIKMPGVTAVAVTEVAVREGVSVIAAFYTGPAPLDDTAWATYVDRTLARYKQPRMFIHQAELPCGPNGKILRRKLRDRFESKHD